MASYPPDSSVEVRPFAHIREGDEVIIGDDERQVYLCIPADGLDIVESLAAGRTIAETVRQYEEKYGETPDIDDFLEALEENGFIAAADSAPASSEQARPVVKHDHGFFGRSFDLNWISPSAARRFASTPIVAVCSFVTVAGLLVLALNPDLFPRASVLLFVHGHFALFTVITMAVAVAALLLHELAHAVVARASGVSTRLGLGNLMYVLVAQTDITAIWMSPKRRRYLAYLSGTLLDGLFAGTLIFILTANKYGWIHLSVDVWEPILSAALLTYLFRMLFQVFFYIRTDIYYIIATATNSKNLMADTEDRLRNGVARVLRRPRNLVDQSAIPPRERRTIAIYSVLYIIGRFFALAVLFFYYIPLLIGYAVQFVALLTGRPHRFTAIDFLIAAMLAFVIDGGGIYLWIRGMRKDGRARRQERADRIAKAKSKDPDTLAHSTV